MTEITLDTFDIRKIDVEPLLFQTGYLTVKEVVCSGVVEDYLLEIPNFEVEEALYLNIIAEFTERGNTFAATSYRRLEEHLKAGDLQSTLLVLRALFASIPYNLHVNLEAYYHSIFYAVMSVLGLKINVEVSVSGGRVDAVLDLGNNIYVMEFKYKHCDPNASAEEKRKLFDTALEDGMNQIHKKGYYKKYLASTSASGSTSDSTSSPSTCTVSSGNAYTTSSGNAINASTDKTVHLVAFAFLGRDNIEMRVEHIK